MQEVASDYNGKSPYDLSAEEELALWSTMTDAEKRADNAAGAERQHEQWREQGRELFREGYSLSSCFDRYEREGWEQAAAARYNQQAHSMAQLPEGENW